MRSIWKVFSSFSTKGWFKTGRLSSIAWHQYAERWCEGRFPNTKHKLSSILFHWYLLNDRKTGECWHETTSNSFRNIGIHIDNPQLYDSCALSLCQRYTFDVCVNVSASIFRTQSLLKCRQFTDCNCMTNLRIPNKSVLKLTHFHDTINYHKLQLSKPT